MNSKIRKCILELENLVINDEHNKYIILERINELKNILNNSVIIPKDKLQFVFTGCSERLSFGPDKEIGHITCSILAPKIFYTYIVDKNFGENEKYFMEHTKENLKKKLIDKWSMDKNE